MKTFASPCRRSCVTAIAPWKAQYRLHKRYLKLTAGGKNKNQTVTAVGRELLGSPPAPVPLERIRFSLNGISNACAGLQSRL